jgi:hypothetical protein
VSSLTRPPEVEVPDAGASAGAGPLQLSAGVRVEYVPILDVVRGVAAGFQALVHHDALRPDGAGRSTAAAVAIALDAVCLLPANTFMSIPIPYADAALPAVRAALSAHGGLAGIVLDVTGFDSTARGGEPEAALTSYREAGAKIAVGGHRAAQPELASIIRLTPSILRLGRDWIRGVDRSAAKRAAVQIIGQLAGQLDAWILAESVSTAAELRALAGLEVPLAQGPFIGGPQPDWPAIDLSARRALPAPVVGPDGVLRSLMQQAYTAADAAAATAVLPETSGFDLVVVVDEDRRPVSVLELGAGANWVCSDALTVNIDTPVADTVARAMTRPRAGRFTPLACTDAAGRFLGILRIERLMTHLAERSAEPGSPHSTRV